MGEQTHDQESEQYVQALEKDREQLNLLLLGLLAEYETSGDVSEAIHGVRRYYSAEARNLNNGRTRARHGDA